MVQAEVCLGVGVVESRWAFRSSKPVTGRVAGRGGFDSHPFPPKMTADGVIAPSAEIISSFRI